MVARMLEHAGALVSMAGSVDDALGQLEAVAPDVIVSDIALPFRDGYDFIREIRSHPDVRISGIQVLALTAQGRELDRENILQAGFDGYLRKPVGPAVLIEAVRNVMGRTAARKSHSKT